MFRCHAHWMEAGTYYMTAQRAALPDPLKPLRSPAWLDVSCGLKSTKCGATMCVCSSSLPCRPVYMAAGLSTAYIESSSQCNKKKYVFRHKNYAKRCLSHFTFHIEWNTHSKRIAINSTNEPTDRREQFAELRLKPLCIRVTPIGMQ